MKSGLMYDTTDTIHPTCSEYNKSNNSIHCCITQLTGLIKNYDTRVIIILLCGENNIDANVQIQKKTVCRRQCLSMSNLLYLAHKKVRVPFTFYLFQSTLGLYRNKKQFYKMKYNTIFSSSHGLNHSLSMIPL